MAETIFKVFVSSPGDTEHERLLVKSVIERLNSAFETRARLESLFWEDRFYSAHDTFQSQIDEPARCDLVLAIFRGRLGQQLPASFPRRMPGTGEPFPSGTAYEVLSAIEARRAGQKLPDIFVYRRPEWDWPPLKGDPEAAERTKREYLRLETFFADHFRAPSGEFQAAYKTYRDTSELEAKVEADLRQWLAGQGFAERGATWDRAGEGSPFPGLDAFDARRARIFFGRRALIEQALRELRGGEGAPRPRFLLLLGASGSGKSSLLGAGLVPRLLRPAAIPGVETWCVARVAAGGDMFAELAAALLAPACLGEALGEAALGSKALLEKQLRADLDIAWRPLRRALESTAARRAREAGWPQPRPMELLVVLDQIERCFNETTTAECHAFLALLERCAAEGLATVLGALRSDAYAGLQEVPALLRLRQAGVALDVLPLGPAELEEMLLATAAACEPALLFERGAEGGEPLARRLVRDAAGGDALPLLQVVLTGLYEAQERRHDNRLAAADYPGLEQAVTEQADAALGPPGEAVSGDAVGGGAVEARLRPLVLGLIADVREDAASGEWRPEIRPLPREAFARAFPDSLPLLDALIEARLLVVEAGPDGPRVRPTHEALLRIWPRARAIVQSYAEQIHLRRKLESRVRDWEEASAARRADYLQLPALELAEAGRMRRDLGPILPEPMRRFIAEAEAQARRLRRRRQGFQLAAAAVVAAFVVAIVVLAERARVEARHAELMANRARSEAQHARTLADAARAAALKAKDVAHKLALAEGLAYFGQTTTNYEKSFHYFYPLATNGDATAEQFIGYMYEKGRGVGRDGAKAIFWYRRAARAGNAIAQNNLGYAYENGADGLVRNLTRALYWLHRSAKGGDLAAANNLGYAYEQGLGGLARNPARALSWYRRAAKGGSPSAQNNLGYAYEQGLDGLARNPTRALYWYRRAADAGDAGARLNLAIAYEKGQDGLAKNLRKAAYWYRKAAQSGSPIAENAIGYDYQYGLAGLPRDATRATYWYLKAAGSGDATAAYNLGYLYDHGAEGVPTDATKALHWYRLAARAGDAAAENNLAFAYEYGRDTLPKDPVKSLYWYRKAANRGFAGAQFNLGFDFQYGRNGLTTNLSKAVYWYRKAAAQGLKAARDALGALRR